jgi:uncharacterized protein (TIGR02001 family)
MWSRGISWPGIALLALLVPAHGGESARAIDQESESKSDSDTFESKVGGLLQSDYIYRGISLSKREPSVSGSVEVQRSGFYVGSDIYSVRLPTEPAAELTFTGGVRPEWAGIKFDLAAEYFYYPGETPPAGGSATSYWQYGISAERALPRRFTLGGTVTYSPNAWNSGAWGAYGSGALKFDVAKFRLAKGGDISWSLAGEFGHQSFGTTSQGIALPSYAHWRLGTGFKSGGVGFDLSYHDTNLSRENCFALAGDIAAAPGGVGGRGSNPGGLQSNLCGRALVGTLSVELTPPKSN